MIADTIKTFCEKTSNDGFSIQKTDDNVFVLIREKQIIDSFKINDIENIISQFELFKTFLSDFENKDIINNTIVNSDWHYSNERIRIKFEKDKAIQLLLDYPSFAVYLKQENIIIDKNENTWDVYLKEIKDTALGLRTDVINIIKYYDGIITTNDGADY